MLSFLLSSLAPLLGESKLLKYEPRFHGAIQSLEEQAEADSVSAPPDSIYPARGLILSLAMPGVGEWYAGAKTKALLFFGVEVAAWLSWKSFSEEGEAIERRYEQFADEHWDLFDWWLRTPWLTTTYGDVVCKGTHHLGSEGS